MTRYKKAPNGQWPGYPHLKINEIETLTIQQNRYVAEALVDNRKGRIVLLMDQEFHEKFLTEVRERKGTISARNVNDAVIEAVKTWMKRTTSKERRG